MHAPRLVRLGELAHGVLDDAEQRHELIRGPIEVLARQQPERDDLDPLLLAPLQQVGDVVRAGAVAVADVRGAGGARPAPVAVEDDADVARPGPLRDRASEPSLVDPVDHLAYIHVAPPTPG
jgi:hypothetical protein